jgi:hypothetical protein
MADEIRETDRFTVQNAVGQRLTIIQFTKFMDDGMGGWVEGLKMLRTAGQLQGAGPVCTT